MRQERKQLKIAQNVEREQIVAVQHCLLAHLEELRAAQEEKHEEAGRGAEIDLLINHQDLERENRQLKDQDPG